MGSTTDPTRADPHGQQDPWLFTDEACALLGIERSTFRRLLTKARRAAERGETQPADLPLPGDYCSRQVLRRQGHPITILNAPRWRRSVLEEFKAQRPGKGWAKGTVRESEAQA